MPDDPRHDCDFAKAMAATVKTLAAGIRSHPVDSQAYWLKLSPRAHLVHAAIHCEKFLLDLHDEDHLLRAFCRLLMAVELRERERAGAKETRSNG